MIDLRRVNGVLTLYVSFRPTPKPLVFVGEVAAFALLYFFAIDKTDDPTLRLALTALCIAGPSLVGTVLYLMPRTTTTFSSFDTATRRIRLTRKRDRGTDIVDEVGFDDVAALTVTEDNPERPRFDILSLRLKDGRTIKATMKSRQLAEGADAPAQDLRKVAAYIRSETGLPEDRHARA